MITKEEFESEPYRKIGLILRKVHIYEYRIIC